MLPAMAAKRSQDHDDDDLEPVTTDDVSPSQPEQAEVSDARKKFMAGEIGWREYVAAENQ